MSTIHVKHKRQCVCDLHTATHQGGSDMGMQDSPVCVWIDNVTVRLLLQDMVRLLEGKPHSLMTCNDL